MVSHALHVDDGSIRLQDTCHLDLLLSERRLIEAKAPTARARQVSHLKQGSSPVKTRQIIEEATGLHPRQWDRLSKAKEEADKGK